MCCCVPLYKPYLRRLRLLQVCTLFIPFLMYAVGIRGCTCTFHTRSATPSHGGLGHMFAATGRPSRTSKYRRGAATVNVVGKIKGPYKSTIGSRSSRWMLYRVEVLEVNIEGGLRSDLPLRGVQACVSCRPVKSQDVRSVVCLLPLWSILT